MQPDQSSLFAGLAPRYRTIEMDPPWPEKGGGRVKRGADRHYGVLDKPGCKTVPQILSVIRGCPLWLPYPDAAHLWCWVTDNYLEAGLWLIYQLGFAYKRTFPWIKVRNPVALDDVDEAELVSGIGQYGRGEHELLLFATKGAGMSPLVYQDRRDVGSVLVAPHERGPDGKRIHSRKPRRSYELIEARSKGPYAEIFGRIRRPGWDAWGDELDEDEAALEVT